MIATTAPGSISASAGPLALVAGVLVIEAGVPLPVPSDVLILVLGERAAAGALPLWFAVVLLEVVAVLGTATLFVAVRGPARAALGRLTRRAPRSGRRLQRLAERLEGGGRTALVIGRTTPGLRTLTVVAAAVSRLPAGSALPLLIAGSTVFLQGHLVLGYALGPLADTLLASARPLTLALLIALVVVAAAVWLSRRGRAAGERGFAEASCPACLLIALTQGTLTPDAAGGAGSGDPADGGPLLRQSG